MSDEQLIRETLSGSNKSFGELVQKYQQQVFRTAMGFVHSKEDAEDIAQDVFIKVFHALETFEGKSQFPTWLYRITVNVCINHINKNKWQKLLNIPNDGFKSILNRSDDKKNALQQIEESEREQAIKNAIDLLPTKQRTAFILSKYEDLSQREIAEIMKITEGAVEQLLQRAKLFLRKKLTHIIGK